MDRITTAEVAEMAGVQPAAIRKLVSMGRTRGKSYIPVPLNEGRRPLMWERAVIEEWLASGRPGQGARTDLRKPDADTSTSSD